MKVSHVSPTLNNRSAHVTSNVSKNFLFELLFITIVVADSNHQCRLATNARFSSGLNIPCERWKKVYSKQSQSRLLLKSFYHFDDEIDP